MRLLGALMGLLAAALTVSATPKPLAMGMPGARSQTISLPVFRDASYSAIQLRKSLAAMRSGQHAKIFADLALGVSPHLNPCNLPST